jgi:hypothetical protein
LWKKSIPLKIDKYIYLNKKFNFNVITYFVPKNFSLYAGTYVTRVAPISVDILHKNVTYIKKLIIYDESEGPVRTWMSVMCVPSLAEGMPLHTLTV